MSQDYTLDPDAILQALADLEALYSGTLSTHQRPAAVKRIRAQLQAALATTNTHKPKQSSACHTL